MLAGPACADDTPATTIDFGGPTTSGGSATGSSSSGTAGVDTTESAGGSISGTGSSSTTSDSTSDTDATTTGGQALPGQTMSQLVTAGTRASSRSYQLVYTVGQPSQLQSTHVSDSYRLQGGLVGANGSPP